MLAILLAGAPLVCAQVPRGAPQPASIVLQVTAVPLDPQSARTSVGRFVYAGGVELKRADGARFGGLSDLELTPNGGLLSITDEGDLFRARLVLDGAGRLTGIADGAVTPLIGRDGQPLSDKTMADAEGLALLNGGERLVSFERHHRIWRYPAAGVPVEAPMPEAAGSFPLNGGLEALVALPARGADAYLAGSEGGTVWLCRLAAGCVETPLGAFVPEGFGLTGIATSADGTVIALLVRAYDPVGGVRVQVRLVPAAAVDRAGVRVLDELSLVDPLTRDNFEGIAIAARPGGALRLYVLSDNNFSDQQHTYLLAFDWSPTP